MKTQVMANIDYAGDLHKIAVPSKNVFERSKSHCTIEDVELSSEEGNEFDMEVLQYERDVAIHEANVSKEKLSCVMEMVQILARQMKASHSELMNSDDVSSVELASDLSFDLRLTETDEYNTSEQQSDGEATPPKHNKTRTSNQNNDYDHVAPTPTSISSYMSEDRKRFSELLSHSSSNEHSDLSRTISSDLIALGNSCQMVGQNAALIREEASTVVTDLQNVSSKYHIMQRKYQKAKKCANRLYKENKKLRTEVEEGKSQRKLLVTEIKKFVEEKEDRDRGIFEKELVGALRVHEKIMAEHSQLLRDSKLLDTEVPKQNDKEDGTGSPDRRHTISLGFGRLNPYSSFTFDKGKKMKKNTPTAKQTTPENKDIKFEHSHDQNTLAFEESTPTPSLEVTNSGTSTSTPSVSMHSMHYCPDTPNSDENHEIKSAHSFPVLSLSPTPSMGESIKPTLSMQDLGTYEEEGSNFEISRTDSSISKALSFSSNRGSILMTPTTAPTYDSKEVNTSLSALDPPPTKSLPLAKLVRKKKRVFRQYKL